MKSRLLTVFTARARLFGILVAALATLSLGIGTAAPAGADPAFVSSYVGVGSDTIQDVFNALSGAEPYPPSTATVYSVPLHSSSTSRNKTVSSFDAIPAGGTASAPGCIATKLGGPSFDRPNGSGNGIAALSHAIDGTPWNATTGSCTNTGVNVSGQIDFARSSRGPKTSGTALTFIPFARDAVSYAYFDHSTNTIASLTTAQLKSLYQSPTGTITVGADTVKACLPQLGSGTRSFWETAIGVTDAQADAAATAAGCNGQEENGANTFYTFANALATGVDAVIPFSAGSWIAQANGVALDNSAAGRTGGVDLGNIDGLGKPYTGTPGSEAPNNAFYLSTQYGRNLNVVVSTPKIGALGDAGLKSLFVGSSSSICAADAQATVNRFGFDSLTPAVGTCGSTTTTGALYS